MKNLHQSLIDYDMALLKAIAACRAVSLRTLRKSEAVAALVEVLLSPTETAIMLAGLSKEETEALQLLLDRGSQIAEPHFTRRYGLIRSMGPARLEREKPWQEPANPAEGLWYKGFIFKTFQLTPQGNVEIVFIPTELASILRTAFAPEGNILHDEETDFEEERRKPDAPGLKGDSSLWRPALAPQPGYVVAAEGRLRESMFSLLAYLQTHPVRRQSNERFSEKDQAALANCLPPPLAPTFEAAAELEFLLHLAQRAGLLSQKYGRLRPEREPVRAWLQASAGEQEQFLRNTWRADPTWNELQRLPGLVLQPTGWENSPLLARSKILGALVGLTAQTPGGEWLSLDDFVARIKQHDPDFQRPGGDYERWYIYDTAGNALIGFAHWDAVDGALIRYLLTGLLLLLGVTAVGFSTKNSPPTSFKLTPQGEAFLKNLEPSTPADRKPPFLKVSANFRVDAPAGANLYDRFQLTRFAELERREEKRVVYHITQSSVGRALRNGVTADQMVAFLARVSNNRTPLKVVETLRTWGRRQGTARLERATLLRLENEDLVVELQHNPTLGPLLGETIGPTTVLVPPENVQDVRRLLAELGYLIEGPAQ